MLNPPELPPPPSSPPPNWWRLVAVLAFIPFVVVGVNFVRGYVDDSSSGQQANTEATFQGAPLEPQPFEYGDGHCAPVGRSSQPVQSFDNAPQLCVDLTKAFQALVSTNMGDFTILLHPEKAPGTVNNFVNLARFRYFDDTVCHRAIPGFVVQCGDPSATGSGGPGYNFADELPAPGEYEIGSVAMANAGPGTNGSQFFIITGDQGLALPPSYTLFGSVIDGLSTTVVRLDAAGNPNDNGVPPLQEIVLYSVTIIEQ